MLLFLGMFIIITMYPQKGGSDKLKYTSETIRFCATCENTLFCCEIFPLVLVNDLCVIGKAQPVIEDNFLYVICYNDVHYKKGDIWNGRNNSSNARHSEVFLRCARTQGR